MLERILRDEVKVFLHEDDLARHALSIGALSSEPVKCQLKIKSDLVLAGTPWFKATFNCLGAQLSADFLNNLEGKNINQGEIITFTLPFAVALTGERVALNLLARASSVATYTKKFVDKVHGSGVKILDTRKTTPGLRALEKYAVVKGGGHNHRYGPSDMWMVKDNHKTFFGGVVPAVKHFRNLGASYTPIEVEVHDLKELEEVLKLGIKHVMLDNFSPDEVKQALKVKEDGVTYEVSGGITLNTIAGYIIEGVDAISIGLLTYGAPPVDISLKYGARL